MVVEVPAERVRDGPEPFVGSPVVLHGVSPLAGSDPASGPDAARTPPVTPSVTALSRRSHGAERYSS
ncbi:hypothetical protein GCM10017559_81550 [Streptosporangium longisporum]|uniref:Uncharacterized protein n=1 Tax=Streptosporangium longisporum TaxID=46187 RepID=A0ABP6LDR9_9ACTN